jgi:hypothetical protein
MATKETPPGLGDLFNALGGNNPLTALAKTAEQFRAGVVGFIEAVAAFKQTMDALSTTTVRLNRVLDDLEGPLHVLMPQITATSEQAAKVFAIMSGPVEKMAPGLAQLADTLSSPAIAELPRRLNEAVDVMSALPKTLTPLSQMAEMAGGLFGSGLRSIGGLSGLGQQPGGATSRRTTPMTTRAEPSGQRAVIAAEATPTSSTAGPAAPSRGTTKKAPSKRSTTRKTTAKKTPAKRTAAKKRASSTSTASRRRAGGRSPGA